MGSGSHRQDDDPTGADLELPDRRRLLGLCAAGMAFPWTVAHAMAPAYQEGTHYTLIPGAPAQPAGQPVEVLDVFSYVCIHCMHLCPLIDTWSRSLDRSTVQLTHVPVVFGGDEPYESLARVYYAGLTLRPDNDVRAAVFSSLWSWPHGELFQPHIRSVEDLAAVYAKLGFNEGEVIRVARSAGITSRVRAAGALVTTFKVTGTPEIIVARKYRVMTGSSVALNQLTAIVDFLVAKERPTPHQNSNSRSS